MNTTNGLNLEGDLRQKNNLYNFVSDVGKIFFGNYTRAIITTALIGTYVSGCASNMNSISTEDLKINRVQEIRNSLDLSKTDMKFSGGLEKNLSFSNNY